MPGRLRLAALAPLLLLLPAAGPASPEDGPAPVRPRAVVALSATPPRPAAQAPGPGWGAVYAPLLGGGGAYGLAVSGTGDAEARQEAEARCSRARGEDCRLVAEFNAACGAVAQAVDRQVLVALRPLDAHAIRATAAGGGATREAAGRAALASCERQGRGICVVVAAACAADR